MALQAITISDQSFERAKLHDDFIRDLIFPGGCLPSVTSIMSSIANATDLRVVDLEDIGLHYATTLRLWARNVNERFEQIRALGFDDRFKRLWSMYLRLLRGRLPRTPHLGRPTHLSKPDAPSAVGLSRQRHRASLATSRAPRRPEPTLAGIPTPS